MRKPFTFNHRGLLAWLAAVIVVAASLAYKFEAAPFIYAAAAAFFATGAAFSRVRDGKLLVYEFPAPRPWEGVVAATGVALFVGALIGKGFLWLASGPG